MHDRTTRTSTVPGSTVGAGTSSTTTCPRRTRTCFIAAGAGAAPALQRGGDRAKQDLHVEPQRPPVDVLEIRLDPAVELRLAPAADLPQAGDPGLHRQPTAVPQVV